MRYLILDDGELEARGHLKGGGHGRVHVGVNGRAVPGIRITAARGYGESPDDQNDRVAAMQSVLLRSPRLGLPLDDVAVRVLRFERSAHGVAIVVRDGAEQ